MATVPKSRISRSKRGMRRSVKLRMPYYSASICPNCKATIRPHRLCLSCGWYKNRQVAGSDSNTSTQ